MLHIVCHEGNEKKRDTIAASWNGPNRKRYHHQALARTCSRRTLVTAEGPQPGEPSGRRAGGFSQDHTPTREPRDPAVVLVVLSEGDENSCPREAPAGGVHRQLQSRSPNWKRPRRPSVGERVDRYVQAMECHSVMKRNALPNMKHVEEP